MTMNIIQREAQYDKYTPEQLMEGMKRGGEDAGMMSMALMRRNKGAGGGGMKMRGLGSPGMTGMPSGGMPAPPAQGFAAGGLAERRAMYDPIFREAASAKNPYDLLMQQAIWESGLKNDAVSSAGAGGVSQFMPATAEQYGVDRSDPRSSIYGQRAYMDDLHDMFGGNLEAKLAGYNAGQGNVQKAMESAKSQDWNVWKNFLPMPEETIPYVEGIKSKMNMADYQASGAALGSGGASAPGAGILGAVTELGENGGSIPGATEGSNPMKDYMEMKMLGQLMNPKQASGPTGFDTAVQNMMFAGSAPSRGMAEGGAVELDQLEEQSEASDKRSDVKKLIEAVIAQGGLGASLVAGHADSMGLTDQVERLPGALMTPDIGINPMYAQGGVVGFADAGQVTGDYGHYKRTLDRNEMDLWALKRAQKSHEKYGTGSAETADRILDLEQVIEQQRADQTEQEMYKLDENGLTAADRAVMGLGATTPDTSGGTSGSWGEPLNDDRGLLDVPLDDGIMSEAIDIGNNAMSGAKNWGLDQLGAVSSSAEDMLNFGKVLFGQGEYQNDSPVSLPAKTSPYPPLPPRGLSEYEKQQNLSTLQNNTPGGIATIPYTGENQEMYQNAKFGDKSIYFGPNDQRNVENAIQNAERSGEIKNINLLPPSGPMSELLPEGGTIVDDAGDPVEGDGWGEAKETKIETGITPPVKTAPAPAPAAAMPAAPQQQQGLMGQLQEFLNEAKGIRREYKANDPRELARRTRGGFLGGLGTLGRTGTNNIAFRVMRGAGSAEEARAKYRTAMRASETGLLDQQRAGIGAGINSDVAMINAMAGNKTSGSNELTRIVSQANKVRGQIEKAETEFDTMDKSMDTKGRVSYLVSHKWERIQELKRELSRLTREAEGRIGMSVQPAYEDQLMPGTVPAPTTAPGVTNIRVTE